MRMSEWSKPRAHCVPKYTTNLLDCQNKHKQHKPYISFTFSLCSDLWPRSASGVDDAVGEVSMTVEIFSDPSTGGHKITVKGASVGQICSMSLIISVRISLIMYPCVIDSCGSQWPSLADAGHFPALRGGLHRRPLPQWQEEEVRHQIQEQQLVPEVQRILPVVRV